MILDEIKRKRFRIEGNQNRSFLIAFNFNLFIRIIKLDGKYNNYIIIDYI